jgi:hypothetical protein
MESIRKNIYKELTDALAHRKQKFIFLSGSAGTGKTTFVQEIKTKYPKSVIVAPTGIAALNSGGKTIHSLFQIGFGPLPSLYRIKSKYSKNLLKNINLLLIDEISMVRADLLDTISERLRKIKGNAKPFGGVLVLVAGDLFQLEPVVKSSNTKQILQSKYGVQRPFFFDSLEFKRVIKNESFKAYELTETYRQKGDKYFTTLLDNIRFKQDLSKTIQIFNDRCYGNHFDYDSALHLTSTNAIAEAINLEKLDEIQQPVKKFKYSSTGKYFEDEKVTTPAPRELQLKVGAKVLFIKNDSDELKRWVNGSIGTIRKIFDKKKILEIEVKGKVFDVIPDTWEKINYKYDKEAEEITEDIIATYTQFPIRLGWAITIHKSQGLTLESCSIDLGFGAFAHGQTYVALSRCKRLKDINLVEPLEVSDIKVNERVIIFHKDLSPVKQKTGKIKPRKLASSKEKKSLVEVLQEAEDQLIHARHLAKQIDTPWGIAEEIIIDIRKAADEFIKENQLDISGGEDKDREAMEQLLSLRWSIAQSEGLGWKKIGNIFSRKTIKQMVNNKPENLDEMLDIYGVGPIKLEKYGQQFLDVLKDVFH